jgi:hypothetical protein
VLVEVAFSGFLVPAGDMPDAMRVLSYASSVQHYLVVLRSVMLRGAGIRQLWVHGVALVGISAALVGLAWLRLRAGLDTDSLQQRVRGAWRRAQRWWCEERPPLCPWRRQTRGTKPGWSGEPA